ncbi:MAG: hypothetical protein J6Y04_08540 [Bacteroidaceae bacterium]|nr:hypothetical protein [Bacteroidaceae bacterium]
MKKFLFLLTLLSLSLSALAEDNGIYDLVAGHDYYIFNTYYQRVLAPSADQSQPRLVKYSKTNDTQYLFTAEAAPTAGAFLLKHKSTGKYVTASTSNSYSVSLTTSSGTGKNYQWSVRPGINGQLINLRDADSALGVDEGETADYIGVWYDKAQGTATSRFQIFESNGKGMESSRLAWAKKELQHVSSYILDEVQNTGYPAFYRSRLTTSAENATQWIEGSDEMTPDTVLSKAQDLRDSLAIMTSYESTVLLTATDMASFGTTFSLGLSEFAIAEKYPEDSVYVLIRNSEGRGARVVLREGGNYAFVYQNAKLHVYKEGTLLATLPTYYVPQLTAQGTEAEWTLIRKSRMGGGLPELLSESKAVTKSGEITVDKYGNNTRTVVSLSNTTMKLEGQIDFHIISESAPLTKCSINLASDQAWLIFDNTLPSDVISKYLSQIKINGRTATNGTNCRVAIYLNGALVMPCSSTDKVFVGYDGEQYSGEELKFGVGMHKNLAKNANRIRSFRLKRGYMATVASGTTGSGYSRVYVADHHDIEVPVLPQALYGRISSITIKKWQYVSKKGWCSTTSNSSIATECKKVRATWFYTWSADRASTYDTEYIPIRQHLFWPSVSQITEQTDATACLSFNEPEHSEQHTSDKCSCGGVISTWTSCTKTPDFQETGMRIGSPAPTDASWLKEYIGHCNDMAYRCDFVAIHSYWGTNEAANAQAWYNQLKSIYNNTKRPIWITEWNNGASWTTESWPSGYNEKLEKQRKAIKEIQHMLDTCSFVERYAIYNWDTYYRAMINWDDGSVLPAGKVYRDAKSDFAYNSKVQFTPVWWTPSIKTPTLKTVINDIDETLTVTITNANGDLTDVLTLQRFNEETGLWEDYYTETQRYLFDNDELTYSFPLSEIGGDGVQLRVYVRRTQGDEVYSLDSTAGYVVNPNIQTTSKTSVESWTCQKSAANGFTKATGDTYLEVWDATAAGMQFDYYQDISDLPRGIYELSAAVFNTTDNVSDAKVNGSVVLYAQSDSVQYLMPVTEDHEIDYDRRLTISGIVVLDGKMRIGVKNLGEMSARWAGADAFRLIRVSDLDTDSHRQYMEARAKAEAYARETFFKNGNDASAYVINPSCQRQDTYAWAVTNNGTNTGEASDGVSSNAYWNLWKGSAFTSTMSQDIVYLPEGKYAANALLRGNADAKISLTATVVGPKPENEGTVTTTITPTGNTGGIRNGWQQAQTPFITVRPGDTLHLTMKAEITGASGWWSADDFGLSWQFVEPLPDGIDGPLSNSPRGEENQMIFDLSGRKVSKMTKGIYIKGGRKVVK